MRREAFEDDIKAAVPDGWTFLREEDKQWRGGGFQLTATTVVASRSTPRAEWETLHGNVVGQIQQRWASAGVAIWQSSTTTNETTAGRIASRTLTYQRRGDMGTVRVVAIGLGDQLTIIVTHMGR
jgi:hypothetical protein